MAPTKKDDAKQRQSAVEMCQEARQLWLSATKDADLKRVETLYRQALQRRQPSSSSSSSSTANATNTSRKKQKTMPLELDTEEHRAAFEKLALLWCQSGRAAKAKPALSELGYTCRLSSSCLDYPRVQKQLTAAKRKKKRADPPCIVCDNFLSTFQLSHLQQTLKDQQSSYWVDHKYAVEPPTPYFSYVMPVQDTVKHGFLGDLVQQILVCPNVRRKFPKLSKTQFVELWMHNRPHASGHQMHFDSDNEGRGGVRNPIMSTILYVTAGTGGPSLVTNQTLADNDLADSGWLCHAVERRLVAFDGKVLHGVVPGKGVKTGRRVTLMCAFWPKIRIRKGDGPGAARPFPVGKDKPEWLRQLHGTGNEGAGKKKSKERIVETPPIEVDCVYETLDGDEWTGGMGMPEYDEVFQGF